MITVLTSHNHIWEPDRVAAEIIAEYQTQEHVDISLNKEGPCCDAVGMYKLLDGICKLFDFDKGKISIYTSNAEEMHPEYNVKIGIYWY